MKPTSLKVGTLFRDGDRLFMYTGVRFAEIHERDLVTPASLLEAAPTFRSVDIRFFLEKSGKLRCWTTDWKITQRMLEQAEYFHSWATDNGGGISVLCVGDYPRGN